MPNFIVLGPTMRPLDKRHTHIYINIYIYIYINNGAKTEVTYDPFFFDITLVVKRTVSNILSDV